LALRVEPGTVLEEEDKNAIESCLTWTTPSNVS
jgi:hypothetical protein